MGRRSPKLPGSTVHTALDFTPPERFWDAVERCTGTLSEENRARFAHLVGSYYSQAQFEENAVDLALAETRLVALRRCGEAFWRSLWMTSEHEEFEEAAKQLSASSHVEHVVNWELERASNFNFYVGPRGFDDQEVATIPRGDLLASEDEEWVRLKVIQPRIRRLSITNISSMMTDYLSACDAAERELAQHRDSDYYRPGEAWDRFVLHLKYFWESLGPAHKATVNKNYDAPLPLCVIREHGAVSDRSAVPAS
jgi:hypothetical protein